MVAADAALEAASDQLFDVKEKVDNASKGGELWWMDREWEEAKKYMSEKQIARMELKRQKSLSSMKWAKIHGKRIPINIYDEKKKRQRQEESFNFSAQMLFVQSSAATTARSTNNWVQSGTINN